MPIIRRQRKTLLFLLMLLPLLAALLWTGSSYYLGIKAEEYLRRNLGGPENTDQGRLYLTDYQRGLFSSRARTELRFAGSSGDQAPLRLQHRIRHGFLPAAGARGGGGGLGKPLLAVIDSRSPDSAAAGFPAIEVRTSVDLSGQASSTLQIAAGSKSWPLNRYQLGGQWGAVVGELYFPANLRELTGTLRTTRLDLQTSSAARQNAMTWHDVVWDFSYRSGVDGQGGENLALELALAVDRITTAAAESYGPLELAVTGTNFDREATWRLLNLAPWWLGLATDPAGRQMPPAVAQALVEAIPRLLHNSPVVEVTKARLQTAAGPAHGQFRLAYQGRDNSRPFHPLMLISGLQLTVATQAPQRLLAAYPEQLASLRQRNYLSADEATGTYGFNLHYQAGELAINGRPAPLQHLWYLARRTLLP